MDAPPPPSYAYDIPSLSQSIVGLPDLGNLDTNKAVVVGTPVSPLNLVDARTVVKKLKATLDSPMNPGVTDEMVEAARLRLRAVEDAHTAALYTPGLTATMATVLQRLDGGLTAINGRLDDIDGRLDAIDGRLNAMDGRLNAMDGRLNTMDGRLNILDATTQNYRLIAQNVKNQPYFVPLHKTIRGSGIDRARALAKRGEVRNLTVPPEPPAIGERPFTIANTFVAYTNVEICNLITFYNNDFGIVETDTEVARRAKLIQFLSHY